MPLVQMQSKPDTIQELKAAYDQSAFESFSADPDDSRYAFGAPQHIFGLGAANTTASQEALRKAAILAALTFYDLRSSDNATPSTLATRVANRYLAVAKNYWGGDFRPETVNNDPQFAIAVAKETPLSRLRGAAAASKGFVGMGLTTWLIVGAVAVGVYFYIVKRGDTGSIV